MKLRIVLEPARRWLHRLCPFPSRMDYEGDSLEEALEKSGKLLIFYLEPVEEILLSTKKEFQEIEV